MENNYNPNIPEWANVNYLRMFVYDDAQMNVLKMALPFQTNHKNRGIEREKKNLECRI
jgi:hypothetical protein